MTRPTRRVVLVVPVGLLLALVAGCSGGDEEAATVESPRTQAAPATTTRRAGRIERRLTKAGFHVDRGPVPEGFVGGRVFLTTGVGPMIVYIVGFRTVPQASAYGRAVAETARTAPKQVVARRVGQNVYSGVVAERPGEVATVAALLEAVRAAEGSGVQLIRLGPR